MSSLSISVFFPAYNDEHSIPKLVNDTTEILSPLTDDYEIIVVDDCSPDNVGKIADEMAKKDSHIKVIHHEKNRGYGGALKSGFNAATKDYIFYTDGDAQYDVKELLNLLPFREEYGLVNGYKIKRSDKLHRTILGKMYHHFARLIFGLRVSDVDCDFRLFKKDLIKNIKLESNEGFICVEMIYKVSRTNCKIKEVPVHHYPRMYGESQFFNVRRITKSFKSLGKGWWKFVVLRDYK